MATAYSIPPPVRRNDRIRGYPNTVRFPNEFWRLQLGSAKCRNTALESPFGSESTESFCAQSKGAEGFSKDALIESSIHEHCEPYKCDRGRERIRVIHLWGSLSGGGRETGRGRNQCTLLTANILQRFGACLQMATSMPRHMPVLLT